MIGSLDLAQSPAQAGASHCESAGRAWLSGAQCLCGDAIKAGDLVAADFDNRDVHSGGGLYLVQAADGYMGCRRMMQVPDWIAVDQTGRRLGHISQPR